MSLPPIPAGLAPLPDAEKAIADLLAARSELASVASVGDRIPTDYDGSQLVVTVDRLGGPADRSTMSWRETVHLDIKSYGATKADAAALSATVRYLVAALPYLESPSVVFEASAENVGPQWFPDATADYPESGYYLLQVAVTLHPAP